jgi:hypothetical protein
MLIEPRRPAAMGLILSLDPAGVIGGLALQILNGLARIAAIFIEPIGDVEQRPGAEEPAVRTVSSSAD